MEPPLISIVTPSLDACEKLVATVHSVRKQNYPRMEHVIVDGGSTDLTLEFLKSLDQEGVCWISEPDRGISEAFNKGLQMARGEWILFLNAGDTFAGSDVLKSMVRAGRVDVNIVTAFSRWEKGHLPRGVLHNRQPLFQKARLSHQASLVRRRVFNEIGGFSTDYRVRMDYDFWLRALKRFRFVFLPEVVVNFDAGISLQRPDLHFREALLAHRRHLAYGSLLNGLMHAKRFLGMTLRLTAG